MNIFYLFWALLHSVSASISSNGESPVFEIQFQDEDIIFVLCHVFLLYSNKKKLFQREKSTSIAKVVKFNMKNYYRYSFEPDKVIRIEKNIADSNWDVPLHFQFSLTAIYYHQMVYRKMTTQNSIMKLFASGFRESIVNFG